MLNTYDRGGVTVAELSRGPVNALDLELLGALTAVFDRADSPVVLTGAGRTFSAGVDLRRIVEEPDSYVAEFLAALARAFLAVFTHPRPTVAAINGHAIAGGCLFALCCDTRVMSAGTIGLTELAVGVPFPHSGLEIVRHALGPASGRVVLRADTVDRDEALRLGVADEIAEPAVLLDRAVALASHLGSYPAAAYAAAKRDLQRPALQAVGAGDDAAVTAAWSSPQTRQRLAGHLAALDDQFQGVAWLRRQGEGVQDQFVTTDLDTLATALYVRTDDLLKESPQLAPCRPEVGIDPKLGDAELVTLAVMQALLGFTSEARWLRHARAHLRHLFPYLPQQPGYNKRLRAAASMIRHCIRVLAAGTSVWTDDVWVVDSTPVECGRSRETAKRSDLAGWAEYGYCASHSRYFWGLRLHLVVHPAGPARRLRPGRRESR